MIGANGAGKTSIVRALSGILYAPDYVISGGGLIQLDVEHKGYDAVMVELRVRAIADTLIEVYRRADKGNIPTSWAADQLAEKRLREVR